jgi:cell division protein FtsN
MRDYKETVSRGAPRGVPRGQKSGQFKRLFSIMGGMILAFAIFIVGVRVGIQIERQRVRIAQEATAPMTVGKEKEGTEKKEKTSPSSGNKDEKMRFTFYETLTRKEGSGKEVPEKGQTAKKEQAKVAEKKGETKTSPAKATKVEEAKKEAETKKEAEAKQLYFVQIASFQEEETAEGLKARLVKKGYPAHVVPVHIEGMGLWYRVRLGGYTKLREAQEAQKRISVEEQIEETQVVSGP